MFLRTIPPPLPTALPAFCVMFCEPRVNEGEEEDKERKDGRYLLSSWAWLGGELAPDLNKK